MNDLIRREDALDAVEGWMGYPIVDETLVRVMTDIKDLPSAEQEEFEWCTDCKEYDQEAHCCHRWTKCIRNTIKEIKSAERRGEWIREPNCYYRCSVCGEHYPSIQDSMSFNFCPNCGCRMKGEEE